jgi:hypothetical protein
MRVRQSAPAREKGALVHAARSVNGLALMIDDVAPMRAVLCERVH